ncbi:ATP-binding protein [Clostridium botulinum]|uniref:ATP-binding protein n=1 Tax=Clostridium botulinum TaxID=1491 RepID=A0A846I9D1_CLOBO|nr:hypothetical protein [Clostridium botulinum]AJE13337.1 putative precorrin-6y methylase [Clostridium botulinum CDC_1436]MBO0524952.1 ATP-binding protein [Clostridium botulinum]MBO0528626.1 ATP-binding protein [Clostridium botulinum]MBO0532609.1 ATP-binding protein [Clostridium botulinum]MBO0535257.1 ATP-binding protein [Clostridium botulinum]
MMFKFKKLSNCKRILFFLILLFFTNIRTVKANATTPMPMPPSIMDSSKEIDRDITSLEDATVIKSNDGRYSNLVLNKSVREPLKLGNLGKGEVRIEVTVGMIKDEPVVMAEKDSVMEQQLKQKVNDKEQRINDNMESDKTLKYVLIVLAVIVVIAITLDLSYKL